MSIGNGVTANEIFRRYHKAYCKEHSGHIPPQNYKVINALSTCKTAYLGGHLYKCDSCEKQHIVYNSCKNRHCPECQSLKATEWLLKRRSEMLPIQYFHVVFTVPEELNPLFLQNKKVMYEILLSSVSKSIIQLSKDPKYLGVGQTDFISVLHTWSQILLLHPHIHCIVLGGGISKDKKRWVSCKKDYFINVKVLSARFRSIFLKAVKALYRERELYFYGKYKELNWKNVFQNLIDILFSKSWVVYSEANYSNAKHIFDYIGRYLQRVAISNQRIIKLKQDIVYFRYKDYADNGKVKVMKIEAVEFMRRFLLHVLPMRFVKIRYYGLLGFRNRGEKLKTCRKLLEVKEDELANEEIPETWRDLYEFVTGNKIERCSYCKKGRLIYVEKILPYRLARVP